jgi:hypothetical protein
LLTKCKDLSVLKLNLKYLSIGEKCLNADQQRDYSKILTGIERSGMTSTGLANSL